MIQRNKGHTQGFDDLILIPKEEANRFRGSILMLLELVNLEKSEKVQQEDVKTIYRLLEYLTKSN